jgi:DEAD/DEAH box helicase domain-containing protein
MTLCPTCHHRAETIRGKRSALGGLAHALASIAPLFLMCDPRDLGVITEVRAKGTQSPTITLFDRLPDGLGLSERLYELHHELLEGALELVQRCTCQEGCPACVGPVLPGGGEVKVVTIRLLEVLLGKGSFQQSG